MSKFSMFEVRSSHRFITAVQVSNDKIKTTVLNFLKLGVLRVLSELAETNEDE